MPEKDQGLNMPDDELKYLEFLQAAISRMASNSFVVKAWSVALGTAVLGFSVKESNRTLALVAVLPVICFWLLDAYYLALEKSFRDLWEKAVAGTAEKFNMKVRRPGPKAWWGAAWRPAVWLVHLPVFISSLLAALILFLVHTPK